MSAAENGGGFALGRADGARGNPRRGDEVDSHDGGREVQHHGWECAPGGRVLRCRPGHFVVTRRSRVYRTRYRGHILAGAPSYRQALMSARSFRGVRTIRFGDFEFDVRACELIRAGTRVRLQEQPLRILVALLERPGEVVTRDEIRKRLWPNGTVVEVSHGINAAVQRLRDALGDSAESPKFVETLARRGYRFIALVEVGLKTATVTAEAVSEPAPPPEVSHFRVLERLGAGGMGVVYRAEDRKLGRSVALKFLPDSLARDAAALARFRREAQAASALNHPNICTVYGVEECEGKPVIVMEFIAGESLEAVLQRGPLAPERAVALAVQMADALEAAHVAGVVHRDFKPANILVTAAGVKVLDFGLAKMEHPPALGFEPPNVTREGAILGTLHYLSPEQVEGQPAESRSDLFSLGAVLYEMLTGRRAFDGPSAAQVMAAILALPPAPLAGSIPRGLESVVMRCLAKKPEERWQSAADLRVALERLPAPAKAAAQITGHRARLVTAVAAVAAALAAGWFGLVKFVAPPSLALAKMAIPAPGSAPPFSMDLRPAAAREKTAVPAPRVTVLDLPATVTRIGLSPDGRRLAYIAEGHLWIAPIAGGAPAMYGAATGIPFWSPDSRWVAAAWGGQLMRFDVATQQTASICRVDTNFAGAWAADGTILIGAVRGPLYSVAAEGGEPRPLTTLDSARGETRHIAMQFLPDGRRFLYVAASVEENRNLLYVGSLDSNERTAIMPAPSRVQFAGGYLIYANNSMLMARAFDWKRLRVSGPAMALGVDAGFDVAANAGLRLARFSAAENLLAFIPAPGGQVTVIRNWAARLK